MFFRVFPRFENLLTAFFRVFSMFA